ncbi:hypothetical protein HRE53_06635 [Acaryochloris sp. 'Moss Beach']|uniref:hypothetical protein n=1 Tax=Acaryochloris sp. 'Moss Beach' TaxID=2740837 RepID=UPI001F1A0B60|nr:hypothetical protein [Acaryochloris sp. 'Moss Beach']UJB70728.1 hypothetical protein HRE53_06635 [Acaryochloris sp. 'Moss Beach']
MDILERFWNWYILGFRSQPNKSLYESPRFWRIVLTLFVWGLVSQVFSSVIGILVVIPVTLVLLCLIVWMYCTHSGQAFLKNYSNTQTKIILLESSLSRCFEENHQKSKYKELMDAMRNLSTFSDVEDWDSQAEIELNKLANCIQTLEKEISSHSQYIGRRKIEHFKDKYILPMENWAEELQSSIDFTPNSVHEQKLLLKELRYRKKELLLQKRELSAEAKEIRNNSRVRSVKAGRFLGIYNSKMAASERRLIRYQREAQVAPYEDLKTSIDRQILSIDKKIIWVERFTECDLSHI